MKVRTRARDPGAAEAENRARLAAALSRPRARVLARLAVEDSARPENVATATSKLGFRESVGGASIPRRRPSSPLERAVDTLEEAHAQP